MNTQQWIMLILASVDFCLAGVCMAIWHQDRAGHLLLWALGWLGLSLAHGCSMALTWSHGNSALFIALLLGMLSCLSGWTLGITRFLGRRRPRWIVILGLPVLLWNVGLAILAPQAGSWASIPLLWMAGFVFAWLGWLLARSFPKARVTAVITAIPFWLMALLAAVAPFQVHAENQLPGAGFYGGSAIGVVILGLGLLLLHHHQKHEALLSAVKGLSTERERAARLIANSPIGIIILGVGREVASFNRAASSLTGIDAGEVLGRPFSRLVARLGDELAKVVGSSSDGEPPVQVEISTAAGGSHAHVLVNTWLLGSTGEQVISLQDITVEAHLSDMLEHQQRLEAIGQLAGGVAHDFNNLLVGIMGHADLLRLEIVDESQIEDVVQIQRSAARAAELTQKLLAFGRKQVLQPRLIDLRAVVEEISLLLRRIIGETVELVTDLGDDPVLAEVDAGQLEQVVVNMATNAKLAISGNGRLTLRTELRTLDPTTTSDVVELPPGRYACLIVEDDGVGMSPEVQQRIFDPFFTTRAVGEGTGLGLSTAHGIVRQSKGDILVRSEVGQGTTFVVLLPESAGEPEPVEQPAISPGPTGSGRVLVVEDEEIVVRLIVKTLEGGGYSVMQAADGEVALELVTERGVAGIDLLISDVVMPRLNGPELVARLREQRSDLPVLFVSGYPSTSLLKLDEQTAFLSKPFTHGDLLEQVAKLLPREH